MILWELLTAEIPFRDYLHGPGVRHSPRPCLNTRRPNAFFGCPPPPPPPCLLPPAQRFGGGTNAFFIWIVGVCSPPRMGLAGGVQVSGSLAKMRCVEICTNDRRPVLPRNAAFFGVGAAEHAQLTALIEECWRRHPHDRPRFEVRCFLFFLHFPCVGEGGRVCVPSGWRVTKSSRAAPSPPTPAAGHPCVRRSLARSRRASRSAWPCATSRSARRAPPPSRSMAAAPQRSRRSDDRQGWLSLRASLHAAAA
jgi:hypothetical protein